MENNNIEPINIDDFKLDFEEKEINNDQKELVGDMDTRTITTTRRFITKITCRGSCTCNCTSICFA
ncbi:MULTISPECIES: hypothetical protein [Staphylococcus]|nr:MULTISPECIES: hypothetical protein [Staphylococcus]EJY95148.1 hypothetical protein SARL_09892 [Staphylococcus arlettae CVD059]MBF0737763.1 hypothetical protein [Staphylococcus arlettae]MBK3720486.1 hypothetical protein [Staphylococcus arlettae]MCD8888146.1 hypothetical protein [Staphylococcus arlettae]MCD9055639.1 hypothetical protein [Staphylococcus arlettae]